MSNLIQITDYSIEYNDKKILEKANIEFSSGKVYLLEGKNGTGKSTLIKSLLGLERTSKKQEGSIIIENSKNVLEMNDSELLALRSSIAYLEQKDQYDYFRGVTVLDILKDSYSAFKKHKLLKEDMDIIISTFNHYSKNCSFSLNTKVNKLSGGQQRLLSIISAICLRKDAKIFLLDEPLNNLDINAITSISDIINNLVREKTDSVFIIVSHCKIFPFITDVVKIEDNVLKKSEDKVECYACFGIPDENGFYNLNI